MASARLFGLATSRGVELGRSVEAVRRLDGAGQVARMAATQAKLAALAKIKPSEVPITTNVLGYRMTGSAWILSYLFYEVFVSAKYAVTLDRERPFIVDCGGNIGMATLYFARAHPAASILTFEPDPVNFSYLRRNVEDNGLSGRVEAVQAALCDEAGEVTLYPEHSVGGGILTSLDPERGKQEGIIVPGVQLSSHLEGRHVDLLKLDVEGAEWQVMRDLEQSDALRRVDNLVMEYHHHLRPEDDRLSQMLAILERNHFTYRLLAPADPSTSIDRCQDVGIVARRTGGA